MIKTFHNKKAIYCLLVLYLFAFFGPSILSSGLYYDDALNFYTPGYNYFGIGTFEFTINIIKKWINEGRFFPFSFYSYALFAVFRSVKIYKILLLISTLSSCILSGILIEKITQNRKNGILSILLFPLFVPLSNTYFSSIYGFHMLVQSTVLLCTISLILYYNYVTTDKKCFLFISIFLLTIALFMYEMAYVFFIGYVVIAFLGSSNNRKHLKKLCPIFITFGLGVSTYLFFRLTNGSYYSGTKLNIAPQQIIITFFKQLSGSIPQIRYNTEASSFGLNKFTDMFSCSFFFIYCFVCCLFIVLLYMCFAAIENKEISNKCFGVSRGGGGVIYGVFLCILPAGLISASSRYQNEITWGKGYQVFYISSIGLAIIMAVIMNTFLKKARLNLKVVAYILIIVVGCNTIIENLCLGEKTVASQNEYTNARSAVNNAIGYGILNDIQSNDVLISNSTAVFDKMESAAFYSDIAEIKIQACNPNEFASLIYGTDNRVGYVTFDYTGDTYVISNQVTDEKGVVILARLKYYDNGLSYCSGSAKVYIEDYTDNVVSFEDVNLKDNYTMDELFLEFSN